MTSTRILLASASLAALSSSGALAADAGVPAVERVDAVASTNLLASGMIEVPAEIGTMKIENGPALFLLRFCRRRRA